MNVRSRRGYRRHAHEGLTAGRGATQPSSVLFANVTYSRMHNITKTAYSGTNDTSSPRSAALPSLLASCGSTQHNSSRRGFPGHAPAALSAGTHTPVCRLGGAQGGAGVVSSHAHAGLLAGPAAGWGRPPRPARRRFARPCAVCINVHGAYALFQSISASPCLG